MKNKTFLYLSILWLFSDGIPVLAQQKMTLTLQQAIMMANDSSLSVLRAQNNYLTSYWAYRTFKAERRPSLTMDFTPISYNRYITKRYDSESNIDVYRPQQAYSADGGLHLSQNFDLTGGTFYIDTDLQYLRNFGDNTYTQFSSVPFRIGYSQTLLGFNSFKWDKRIEPERFEKERKGLIYAMEEISEEVVANFFDVASAQAQYQLAVESKASADSLYIIGERRFKIGSVTKADLLTLQLDVLNAKNSLENARIARKKATSVLAVFLNVDRNANINVVLPAPPAYDEVSVVQAVELARQNSPTLMEKKISVEEAQRELQRTRVENSFNASINASVGFNQYGNRLLGAYKHPLEQDLVSVSVSIPLVDWGLRKGKLNKAKNNLNITCIDAKQEEQNTEEEVTMTVNNFNIQKSLVESTLEAYHIANMAYRQIQERFIIGKADVNAMMLAHSRQQEAQSNYISALQVFWGNYYKIRRLTLYDFEHSASLTDQFNFDRLTGK
jgi:outer membrane protein TolC